MCREISLVLFFSYYPRINGLWSNNLTILQNIANAILFLSIALYREYERCLHRMRRASLNSPADASKHTLFAHMENAKQHFPCPIFFVRSVLFRNRASSSRVRSDRILGLYYPIRRGRPIRVVNYPAENTRRVRIRKRTEKNRSAARASPKNALAR